MANEVKPFCRVPLTVNCCQVVVRVTGVSARDLKRVVAFVIDDLTMEAVDLPPVRKMMLDFVNNKMRDGDLVAIVRVVGGKGLLQQFTTDRALLRRAIASLNTVMHPFSASEVPDAPRIDPRSLRAEATTPENGTPQVDSPIRITSLHYIYPSKPSTQESR